MKRVIVGFLWPALALSAWHVYTRLRIRKALPIYMEWTVTTRVSVTLSSCMGSNLIPGPVLRLESGVWTFTPAPPVVMVNPKVSHDGTLYCMD